MKNVTFLLPAYNEERSIELVIESIKKTFPKAKILVIDNNSTDKTSIIAEKLGSKLIYEHKQGKGHAIKKGFQNISSDYVIMLDSDNTYDPHEANSLLTPLIKNKADVILGSRMNSKKEKGAISFLNIIGNSILSLSTSLFYSKISDVCTGYWAFKKEVIEYLLEEGIQSHGFELEMEMFIKISKSPFKIKEVPITYKRRIDIPKLNTFEDGWKIFKTLFHHKIDYKKYSYSPRKDEKIGNLDTLNK